MGFNVDKGKSFLLRSDSIINERARKSKELTALKECEEARESIDKIASKVFAGFSVRIHLFGSRVIGLATDESDLDIYVEIDNGFSLSRSTDRVTHDTRFAKLLSVLECEAGSGWTVKGKILRTAVPIIICEFKRRYFLGPTISCDINITNGVSVRNSKLVSHMFKLQPEAVKLFHFTKEWMKIQDLTIVKGYTLTILVIFYLQSKNLMPTVRSLQFGASKETIDGCDVHYNQNSSLYTLGISEMKDYKEHVQGFFNFYTNFDFSRVISPFDGETYSTSAYKQMYSKFYLKRPLTGILVAGPCNRGGNCGVPNYDDKELFVNFVKMSKAFFDENNL